MEWLTGMAQNKFLIAGVAAWTTAQVLKTLIHMVIYKKFDLHRLFGDGGMPSGHSATVTSLAVSSAILYGTATFEFAVSTTLALIVCHDAMGVRQETGKQNVVLKELMDAFSGEIEWKFTEVQLKEFVGHTPLQVMAGILTGATVAAIVCNLL